MKMTKTGMFALLAAGGLLAGTPALRAQDNTTPPATKPSHQGPNLDKLAEDLKLTDDQKTKVGAALHARADAMHAIHDDSSLSPEDRKTKRKDAMDQFNASMKSILTADQYTQWKSMNGRHGEHQHQSGGTTNAPSSDLPKN